MWAIRSCSRKAVLSLELGYERTILDKTRVDHGPITHEARKHAALDEVLQGVPALRVDRAEHATFVEEDITGWVAERSGDSSRDFALCYSRHYC
jgi:hypothetical protein